MGTVKVGTSSWTDPTLIKEGHFYPSTARTPERRLRYYAEQFPVVEVDATYYRLPEESAALAWDERTPPGFVFDVKAFALFTLHPTPAARLPADIRGALPPSVVGKSNVYLRDLPQELFRELLHRFHQALLPLQLAGKLGTVMLQLPPWAFPSHENREHLRIVREALPNYRCAVEFRHQSWVNEKNLERTMSFLSDGDFAYVCVDEPQGFKSSVPPLLAVTNPNLAIVRFHGRNSESWAARGLSPSERFRYLYSEQEMAEWVPKLEKLASQAQETHVLMNNCYRDYATTNATQLARLLQA
ncbi:MAG: DUF72 domain-containing protein [Chloroflexota bacterium]|nr:DUF72 domain-containing protein [Chloroflexota bacterium]